MTRLFEVTQGYPYFIQEFARQAWDLAEEGSDVIRPGDVERSIPLAVAELDQGFFQFRAAKTTDPERAYLRAMAELGPGVVRSADVADPPPQEDHPGRPGAGLPDEEGDLLLARASTSSPSPFPMFDQFMKRWIPSLSRPSRDRPRRTLTPSVRPGPSSGSAPTWATGRPPCARGWPSWRRRATSSPSRRSTRPSRWAGPRTRGPSSTWWSSWHTADSPRQLLRPLPGAGGGGPPGAHGPLRAPARSMPMSSSSVI